MMRWKSDISAIQKILWPGHGIVDKKTDYSMIYSGTEQRTGLFQTRFIIKEIGKHVVDYETINDRTCKMMETGRVDRENKIQ